MIKREAGELLPGFVLINIAGNKFFDFGSRCGFVLFTRGAEGGKLYGSVTAQEIVDELFKQYGMVPDTLVTCVFAALTGECGVMGWIKTSKVKHQERRWQKEDMREANMAAQMPAVDPSAEGTPKE